MLQSSKRKTMEQQWVYRVHLHVGIHHKCIQVCYLGRNMRYCYKEHSLLLVSNYSRHPSLQLSNKEGKYSLNRLYRMLRYLYILSIYFYLEQEPYSIEDKSINNIFLTYCCTWKTCWEEIIQFSLILIKSNFAFATSL